MPQGFDAYVIRRISDQRIVYCGITTRGVNRRWTAHKVQARRGETKYIISNAIRKYGPRAFTVEHVACARTISELREIEKLLIAQHETFMPSGYNMTLGGDGIFGFKFPREVVERLCRRREGRKWTEEQKQALREVRSLVPHPMLGKTHSLASIEKMRRAKSGRNIGEANPFFGKRHRPETLTKISGKNNHRFGRHYSKEERALMSGPNNARFGARHTPETLERIRASQLGPKNHAYGKPWCKARRSAQAVIDAATRNANGRQIAFQF